uniref:Phthiocerol/phthiodiolone dimycocerosyl transferase C-terminal domain-containing protein n=1 Tax=Kalanchoe fedtschenkoi TaxID=63787 RepID=A0A7N0THJ1_KALFE
MDLIKNATPVGRAMGSIEQGWCRVITGGTGVTVLTLLLSKPHDVSVIRHALLKIQKNHPLLRSRLHRHQTSNTLLSFITSPTPFIEVQELDLESTSNILRLSDGDTPLQKILEHELNENSWRSSQMLSASSSPCNDLDLFFAKTYLLPDMSKVLALRFHSSICDRTTVVSVMRELPGIILEDGGGDRVAGMRKDGGLRGEANLGIEALMPAGVAKKGLLSRGVNMLAYSLSSLRLTNLNFKDTKQPRSSQVVRMQLNSFETQNVLAGCKSRGINLCGALTAAALMAANSMKSSRDSNRKYGVVTLTDCRSTLNPPLKDYNFGFYHSAVLNTHSIKADETVWDLATRSYQALQESKNSNKHFTDMYDLNYLMCKAAENPSLTPSSSLRTSLISVFDVPVIDNSNDLAYKKVGVEDSMACVSIHGVGPSIAIFDTLRDGRLDCACVYPSPLHSREQMADLVHRMKSLLVGASY